MVTRSQTLAAVFALALLAGGHGAAASGAGLPTGSEPVQLDPGDFSTRIDNRYWPMRPGDRRVFRVTDTDGSKQRSITTVTGETRLIANGVTARVVYTVVREDGRRIEDNLAWYAQDRYGNVWYFGELARELDRGVVTTTQGSWEAGVDGAQPGVIMPARPKVGMAYRQEHYEGVAEDRAKVGSLSERVEVPFGSFGSRVLMIKETEGIQRDLLDYKFYARGVGPVLGVEISGGSGREELLSFRRGPG